MQLTPAQQSQIKGWTEQRDALLLQIRNFTIERDNRRKEADVEALRLSDLHLNIANAEGRLDVFARLEETKKESVGVELAELIARKSRLESEVSTVEEKLKGVKKEYDLLLVSTAALTDSHGIVKDQTDAIKSILGHIKTTSIDHLSEAKELIGTMAAVSNTIIVRANENLSQTKIVLEKLPKYIFELQRPIPIRRTYPANHPNARFGVVRDNEKPA